jgi:hypothetical protein
VVLADLGRWLETRQCRSDRRTFLGEPGMLKLQSGNRCRSKSEGRTPREAIHRSTAKDRPRVGLALDRKRSAVFPLAITRSTAGTALPS